MQLRRRPGLHRTTAVVGILSLLCLVLSLLMAPATAVAISTPDQAPTISRRGGAMPITLDGTDGYVDVPDVSFGGPGSAFTVELWVKPAEWIFFERFIDFGNGPDSDNVLFAMNNGLTLQVFANNNGTTATELNTNNRSLRMGQWAHVAATIGGGNATIYVDGQVWASGPMPSPRAVTRTQNYVGKSNWPDDLYLHGDVADLRVWTTARTQAEIQADMTNTLSGSESGLLLYYPMTEGAGTTTASGKTAVADAQIMNGAGWSSSGLPPAPIFTLEDTTVSLPAIALNDVDAGSGNVTLTMAVKHGTLRFGTVTGVVYSDGSRTADAIGTLADVQTALDSVTYTPAMDYAGTDTLTLNLNDGSQSSGDVQVLITVTRVNHAPSFTAGGDVTVIEDSGAYSQAWATNVLAGPPDEAGQTLTFTVSNDNNDLFSVQPAISADGTLSVTPAAGAHGTATVTVSLSDDGGTANGGVDTSAAQTFTITVTPGYTVTYNGNGSTGGSVPTDNNTYVQGDTFTVAGTGTLVRDGYVFYKWAEAVSGIYAPGETYTVGGTTGNLMFNAIWLKELTISGATADNKTYDGNNTFNINWGFLSDVDPSMSSVFLDHSTATVLADATAGTGKTVTITGLKLGGPDADNYVLKSSTLTLTANITPKALSATGITVNNKAYDGGTTATVNTASGSLNDGVVSGENVTLDLSSATAVFADKNVGTGIGATVSNVKLSGTDAGNYSISSTASATGNITAKAIDATGIRAQNKVYDGSTTATLDKTTVGLRDVISGDTVTLDASAATGAFADKTVGNGKTVTVTGLVLTGTDASNYSLRPYTTTANILPVQTPDPIPTPTPPQKPTEDPIPTPTPPQKPTEEPAPPSKPADEPRPVINLISGSGNGADLDQHKAELSVESSMVESNLVVKMDASDHGQLHPVEVRAVEVPASVVQKLGATYSNIVVQTDVGSISIPAASIASPKDDETTHVSYRIRMEAVDTTKVSNSISPSIQLAVRSASNAENKGLRIVSKVLSLTAERVVESSTGQTTVEPIKSFTKPVTVRIPFDESEDPSSLGVYRLNEQTGEWEYRGGKVNLAERYVEIELESFSHYTVLQRVTFDDIQQHWAQSVVERLAVRRIVKGVAPRLFAPEQQITRAEFTALLVRLLKLPAATSQAQFADVPADKWYAADVRAAAQAGLVTGSGDQFRPEAPISRQEMVVMLVRAAEMQNLKLPVGTVARLASYGDGDQVEGWAAQAMATAIEAGLIQGRNGNLLAPASTATRAETAALLDRFLKLSH